MFKGIRGERKAEGVSWKSARVSEINENIGVMSSRGEAPREALETPTVC